MLLAENQVRQRIINQLLGQINPTIGLSVNELLTTHLTQHEQPNSVFTGPQTTQNFDPA